MAISEKGDHDAVDQGGLPHDNLFYLSHEVVNLLDAFVEIWC